MRHQICSKVSLQGAFFSQNHSVHRALEWQSPVRLSGTNVRQTRAAKTPGERCFLLCYGWDYPQMHTLPECPGCCSPTMGLTTHSLGLVLLPEKCPPVTGTLQHHWEVWGVLREKSQHSTHQHPTAVTTPL